MQQLNFHCYCIRTPMRTESLVVVPVQLWQVSAWLALTLILAPAYACYIAPAASIPLGIGTQPIKNEPMSMRKKLRTIPNWQPTLTCVITCPVCGFVIAMHESGWAQRTKMNRSLHLLARSTPYLTFQGLHQVFSILLHTLFETRPSVSTKFLQQVFGSLSRHDLAQVPL